MAGGEADLIDKVVREATIELAGSDKTVTEVADYFLRYLKAYGSTISPALKVITFAVLRLRDIADPAAWSKQTFPEVPFCTLGSDTEIADTQKTYLNHIECLKNIFPKAHVPKPSATVVSGLCEGVTEETALLIHLKDSAIVTQNDAQSSVTLGLNLPPIEVLNAHTYCTIYEDAMTQIEEATILSAWTHEKKKNYAAFVSMLWGLLKQWDVMILTANNIVGFQASGGMSTKRGLAGVVLCFNRENSAAEDFFPRGPQVFYPILQLLTNAALVESVCHFHARNEKLVHILNIKVQPARVALENLRWQIQEAIGGSFGEDLALFHADTCFDREYPESLKIALQPTLPEQSEMNNRGIWHLSGSEERVKALKKWIKCTLPNRYIHLADDADFKKHVIEKIANMTVEQWNLLFKNEKKDERLEELFLGYGDSNRRSLVFRPHLNRIKNALEGSFQPTNIKMSDSANVSICIDKVTIDYLAITRFVDDINKAAQEHGYFERVRHHPWTWLRLYKGEVKIVWKNKEGDTICCKIPVNEKKSECLLSCPVPLEFIAVETEFEYKTLS